MSSDTMTAITDQHWMQFYHNHQPLMDGTILPPPKEGFPNTTPTLQSSENTSNNNTQLIPKGTSSNNNNNYVPKPIRRRSRASKKTPITLLNANTNNFRALVQQFTGCPTTAMSSLGVHKGPITLNFKNGSRVQQSHLLHHHNSTRVLVPQIGDTTHKNNQVLPQRPAAAAIAQFSWQKQQDQHHQQQQLHPQQLFQEQQQGGNNNYSFEYMKNSNFVPTLDNSSRPSMMEVSDGLVMVMGNDINSVNEFSNDTY